MKVFVTTEVTSSDVSISFEDESTWPEGASTTASEDVIARHDLQDLMWPTPCVGMAIDILAARKPLTWKKIHDELLTSSVKVSHGSFGTYVTASCREPLCSYGARHNRTKDLSTPPEEVGSMDWCIWHIIVSHRLYQKAVRKLRIELM